MWNEQKRVIESQFSPSERLLWSGQPRQGLCLRAADAYLIPFSLLWGGFAIFWESRVISSGAPFFFMLWGIPFVLVGVYMIIGRFFVDAKQRSKTYYGVTSARAIIVSGLFSRKVKSINLRTLPDISLDEKPDGSGTITFGVTNSVSWASGELSFSGGEKQSTPSFVLIPEAKKVYEMIRAAQRRSA
jgi:hypothetical protein